MLKQQLLILLLAVPVYSHMEMSFPAPRRSKYNRNVPQSDIDYSMNSPLNADGSNFPCKRYSKGSTPVETFTAGSTIRVTMAGSTFHEGGHCQFSISYDERNFVVLRTFMKNCFVGTGLSFEVPLPPSTPACDSCVFAWSWVNAVGNREFYMNCADVRIANPTGTFNAIAGPQMVVLNLPGYPGVGEFPPSRNLDDGSRYYEQAPTITISPTNVNGPIVLPPPAPATTVQPRVTTTTVPPAIVTPTVLPPPPQPTQAPPPPPSTGTSCTRERQSRCTGDASFEHCLNGRWTPGQCSRGNKCVNILSKQQAVCVKA